MRSAAEATTQGRSGGACASVGAVWVCVCACVGSGAGCHDGGGMAPGFDKEGGRVLGCQVGSRSVCSHFHRAMRGATQNE